LDQLAIRRVITRE